MITRTWKPLIDNQTHTVVLKHDNLFIGGFSIQVDGKIVIRRKTSQYSWEAKFDIAGKKAKLIGSRNGFLSFEYELSIDNETGSLELQDYSQDEDRSNKPSQSAFWRRLATLAGLHYCPVSGNSEVFRHRLVGEISGYLIAVIRSTYNDRILLPAVVFVIRHAAPSDLEKIRQKIHTDLEVEKFLGNFTRNLKEYVQIEEGNTTFSLRYDCVTKDADAKLAQRIRTALAIVTRYLDPLPGSACEYADCPGHSDTLPSHLVFINGFPTYVHINCLPRLQNLGKENRARYQKAPSGLARFSLLAFGIAFITGLLYSLLMFFAHFIPADWDFLAITMFTIAFFLPITSPMILIRLGYFHFKTKVTLLSSAIGAVFPVFGVFLGKYLHNLLNSLGKVETILPQDYAGAVFILGLLGNFGYWWVVSRELSPLFKPSIEVYHPQTSDKT